MQPYFQYLRKKEGSRYSANITPCIQGSLFSNNKLFWRDSRGFWKMNVITFTNFNTIQEAPCEEYEQNMLGKSKVTGSIATTRKKEAT